MHAIESDHQSLIDEIVAQIRTVQGVRAIVLGGSRARGTHTSTSDIDLGIYYDSDEPIDLQALNAVATLLDDSHHPDLLTPFGGWGPWINGGGWLTIQNIPVDFIYRDLKKVTHIINECLSGQVETVYQPGHPFGFLSSIYMAEIAVCQPLWQSQNQVSKIQALTQPYPSELQRALIGRFAWEISFALATAKKGVARVDVTYVSGCAFRSVMCMCQVLFALNHQYWLNEKGAVAFAETFAMRPENWQARVEQSFQHLTADQTELEEGIHLLASLANDMDRLAQSA